MELPSLGQFRALLQEDILFCDYLNTFLNLPVFSKRFWYNRERRRFEIDPFINSGYHLMEDFNVVMWVHQHRLPLFWHSELFLEYCLSSSLRETNKEMVDVLSSVSGVRQFRRFLFGGKGESACLFWLNVERLRHLEEACAQSRLASKIHHLYLLESSPFFLSAELKELIMFEHKLEEGAGCLPISSRVIKMLLKAQGIVLERLGLYWCKQYTLHLKAPAEQVNELKPSSAVCTSGSTTRCTRHCVTQLPRIVTDEGNANAEKVARKLSHVHFESCKLPHIPSSSCSLTSKVCTGTGIGCLLEGRCARKSLNLALTPSTQKLFHRSSQLSTNSLLTSPHSPKHSSRPLVSIYPYLYASLRSDFLAGNPFLRHLLSAQHTYQRAIDNLLFWQSTELLLTLNEMKRLHRSQLLPGHTTLFTYSEGYPTARNLKQLLCLFVKDKAPHQLDLPSPVRRELSVLLSKGLGQNLLISAQEYVAECLVQPWMDFLAQDHQNFIWNCTTQRLVDRLTSPGRREHSEKAAAELVPDNIVQLTYGSSQLRGMWSALRLAEGAKYPGIQFLPSRRVTGVSLHKPEEDDDDSSSEANEGSLESSLDISLNPMLTTVYTITRTRPKKLSRRILCITRPAHSSDVRHKKKPQPPKSFMEVLKDPEQLEFFRHFLQQHGGGAEVQLLFWTAVEDMKSSMGNERTCRSKTRTIQQRFFHSGTAERILQCRDPAISEVSSHGKPNPFQLLAAQAAVTDTMERAWYQRYRVYLSAEEGKEEEEVDEQKKPVCREHTKGLWNMFAVNVVSFRRGLMNPSTSELFRGYLREEVIKSRGTGGNKKVIGTKAVNVTKLLNDLSFWVEVERYKNLADIVNAARTRGTHTPEDDIMVYKKAHAIVNCYIDSAVSPRVQINIPNEIVQYILDNISQGLISRGLFHEAALNIFSVLIFYWKRFCMVRYAPLSKDSADSVARQPHIATPSRQHSLTSKCSRRRSHLYKHRTSHLYPTPSLFDGIDCGPILSFSLSHGLRWIKPTYGYLHGQVDSQ